MSKYLLQHSSTRPEGWVFTDKENGIVIEFDERRFNDTQRVTFLDDIKADGRDAPQVARDVAKCMQQMGQWLHDHHIGIACDVVYGIEQDEEEDALYLCRYREPRWRMKILDETEAARLATTLNKAAEWLKKRASRQ